MARNAAKSAVSETKHSTKQASGKINKKKTSTGQKKSSGSSSKKSTKTTTKSRSAKSAPKSTAKAAEPTKPKNELSPYSNEIVGVSLIGIGFLLITFWFAGADSKNLATYTNAFLAHTLGFGSVVLPFMLIGSGVVAVMNKRITLSRYKQWAWAAALLTALALVHIMVNEDGTTYSSLPDFIKTSFENGSLSNGGLTGALIGALLVKLITKPAACILCFVILIITVILIFDVSIFNALVALKNFIDYRPEYYEEDDDEDDDEEYITKRGKKRSEILSRYELTDEEADREKLFKKRAERPVFEEYEAGKNRRGRKNAKAEKEELPQEVPDTEAPVNPYHTDKYGKVVGVDLSAARRKNSKPIELYPASPPDPHDYDPNDDNSDINQLFGEDSEEEYDRLLREAEDLFDEQPEKAEFSEPQEALPVEKKVTDTAPAPVKDEDIAPWEEPSDKPQIIVAEETKEYDSLQVEKTETYKFPKLEFLGINKSLNKKQTETEMIAKGEKLRQTLLTFGVEAKVDNICTGPTVTRYELIPKTGTRVQSIIKLEQDIALALAAATVRIEAPIPGKSAIGIEIPNDTIQSVYYSEVLRNERFQNFASKTAFGIGKDIAGNVIVYDIAKAPHMLIAGATGAGKSVCINTLITSILYKATPEEVRLIMVDPKVVELSVYNGIPHLLIPVVTDPKQASGALNWAVSEMMRRYDLFKTQGVRNIEGYNKKEGIEEKLPKIIVIIDELADLMMIAKKSVEDAICRIAQLARAAGIHLIIATQRPSVDVITGLIKANIPTRIAFKVSSGTDSRTVLDTTGAEKLLGRGDMLFRAGDMDKPLRIQGAFVTDDEVAKIVDYIKTDIPNYDTSVIEEIERAENADADETPIETNGSDELIDQVIDFIVRSKKASASAIQRKFRIGFNRAGRIIDELEERGIVGPDNGSKPREVLMTPYERSEYKERHENY